MSTQLFLLQQEDELYNKDKRLDSLKERNLADGNQLDLVRINFYSILQNSFPNDACDLFFVQELTTLTEKISFEITTKEELVQKLEIQYKR